MRINLEFRPTSYNDLPGPVEAAVNGIAGQMRRMMVRDMMTVEGDAREWYDTVLGPIEEELLEERSPREAVQRRSLALGPSWLGGEFLPPLRAGEVEIARVVLQSTTMDVFSLRARPSGGRYGYRMVDEYDTTFRLCRGTSVKPLALRQVIELLETAEGEGLELGAAGLVRGWWNTQRGGGACPEDCTAFAWVESEVYPGLAAWYEEEARVWRERHRAELARQPEPRI